MEINLIASIISTIIGLIGIIISVYVIGRLEGRLKKSVVFLVLSLLTFLILRIIVLFDFFNPINNLEFFRAIGQILIVIFIVAAIYETRKMIAYFNGKVSKRK